MYRLGLDDRGNRRTAGNLFTRCVDRVLEPGFLVAIRIVADLRN